MQLRNYLLHLKENALVIIPAIERILFWVCQANESASTLQSGIVLTGNIVPDDSILKLLKV
jgi:phosphate acetyltransferase